MPGESPRSSSLSDGDEPMDLDEIEIPCCDQVLDVPPTLFVPLKLDMTAREVLLHSAMNLSNKVRKLMRIGVS